MSLYASGILYGLHREEEATLPASLGVIIGAAVGAGLVMAGFGVVGALSGMLFSGVLVAAITLGRSRRAIHDASDKGNDTAIPRRALLHFGMSTMAYAGVAMMLYSIDILLVRHFSGDQQTGFYAAAVQWSEFVWFVPIAIEGVMVQSTAHLWVGGQVEEITRLVSRLMRYVALVTAFLLIFVLAFAEHIVTIYFGPEFRGATLPLQLLIPGAFAFSLARVIRPVIQAHGRVVTLLKIVFGATVMNILLNVAFVPRWGAAGAAVATSVSFIGVAVIYVRSLQAEGVHPFEGFSWGRCMLLCGGTSAVLVPIAKAISGPLMALTVGGIVAVSLYWGGVFRLGLIRFRELEQLVDSLPGPIRRIALRLMHLVQPILVRLDSTAVN
ncbi:MAG: polysaccharide biosynthesis C-terminal domain-containing protein [Nitrospira sp.]